MLTRQRLRFLFINTRSLAVARKQVATSAGYAAVLIGVNLFVQSDVQTAFSRVRDYREIDFKDADDRRASIHQLSHDHPKILIFESKFCDACSALEDHLKKIRSPCLDAQLKILRIDIDARENLELANALDLSQLPSIAVIDDRNRLIDIWVGTVPAQKLGIALNSLVTNKCLM